MSKKTVLVADDERLVRWSIRQKLEAVGYRVVEAESAAEALSRFEEDEPDLTTLDIRMPDDSGLKVLLEMQRLAPRTPVVMITAYGAIDDAVKALKMGAYDYLEKPINFERLINSIRNALVTQGLRSQVERAQKEDRQTYSLDRIVGDSKALKRVKDLVRRVALSEGNTILIQGESGTGKDLVAKALHFESRRGRKPFIIFSCAAFPEQLLENELFGHEKGAFTDAGSVKKGLLEMADGGTVFFDEIGELPLFLQAKLLRVLEDHTFRRIGGTKDIQVDLRIVCASNRDLAQMVGEGGFREDLFYRLSVIPIQLPPLRDRHDDVDRLADYFVDHYNQSFRRSVKGLTLKARKLLRQYDWPGNVRELKNAIERALILQDGDLIDVDIIPLHPASRAGWVPEIPAQGIDLYQVEQELIRKALVKSNGNQTEASRLLSITRDTLRYKMQKYGISSSASLERN